MGMYEEYPRDVERRNLTIVHVFLIALGVVVLISAGVWAATKASKSTVDKKCLTIAQAEKYAAIWANSFEEKVKYIEGKEVAVPAYEALTCTPRVDSLGGDKPGFYGNVVCNIRVGRRLHELTCYIEPNTCNQPVKMPCRLTYDHGEVFLYRFEPMPY